MLPLVGGARKALDSLYAKAKTSLAAGAYDQMLGYSLQALTVAEGGSCEEQAYAHTQVAHAYYYLQQREMAVKHLWQSNRLAKSCGVDSLIRRSYHEAGAIYFELGKPDSAKMVLHMAEKLMLERNDAKELSLLYAILGEVYREQKAKTYFDLAEQYAIKANDTLQIAFANVKLGVYAREQGDCALSLQHLNKGLDLYRKAKMPDGEMYALLMLAERESACGDAKSTLLAFRTYLGLRNTIFKKETADKTAHFRTLYETEKKERENAELIKNRRLLVAIFAITILLLGIAFVIFYSRYKLKKQKEIDRQLAEQQQLRYEAIVQAEENERKRIASDLHDGVGQTMSAAKINLSVIEGDLQFASEEQRNAFHKVVALIDESCKEVRTVSHNMMPNDLLRSGLGTAIRNFIGQIDSRVLSVDLYSEGLDSPLHTNKEVMLYRVIQECVNNVIKHAQATRLYLSLIKDEDGISVTIEDNGKGFDTTNAANFDGIGLKNIQGRVNYLQGTVEWNSAPGKGTAVVIHVPE